MNRWSRTFSYVGYRMTGFSAGVHRGLPSRHLAFIASVGPNIDVALQSDLRQGPASYGCVLSGEHGEMRWPLGGGIMFGTAGKDDSPFGRRTPGNDSVYVVCDDPDALFDRAVAAGAEVERGLVDEDYGSRGFTVRDPEGNLWSFGTYPGE